MTRKRPRRILKASFPGGGWIEPIDHQPGRPRLPFIVRYQSQGGVPQEEGFATSDEAAERHLSLRASSTARLPAMSRTFGEATTVFLSHCTKGTARRTKTALAKHLLPLLSNTRLLDIDELVVAKLESALKGTTSLRLHNELAAWFEQILRQAKQLNWLPVEHDLRMPRQKKPFTRAKQSWLDQGKSKVRPSLRAIEIMIARSKGRGLLHIVILLGIRAGLRIGEMFALKWGEVDLDDGILNVRAGIRSVPLTKAAGNERQTVEQQIRSAPKSRHAYRSLRLHPELKAALIAWRPRDWHDDGSVLFPPGEPERSMSTVRDRFHKFLVELNLATCRVYFSEGGNRVVSFNGAFRIHDLRHACVALWIWEGKSIEEIRRWIGHSEIEMTLTVYGYLLEQYQSGESTWPSADSPAPAAPEPTDLIEVDGQFYREPHRPALPHSSKSAVPQAR